MEKGQKITLDFLTFFHFKFNYFDSLPLSQAFNHVIEILGQLPDFIMGVYRREL